MLGIFAYLSLNQGSSVITDPAANAVSDNEAAEASPIPDTPRTAWTYDASTDPMSDRSEYFACVVSTNEVQLNWPYSSVKARLCLRNSPRFGKDVLVQLLGDGQMMCHSYDGCSVKVRFDTQAAQSYSATSSSDGSSNVIFLGAVGRFVSAVKSADTTIVQAEFYEAGVQAMTFNTAGLDLVAAGFAGKVQQPTTGKPVVGPSSKITPAKSRAATPVPEQETAAAPSEHAARIDGPHIITSPDWARRPNGEDLARFYPDRAQRLEAEGRATIECSVRANGTLEGCSVVSEDPAGYGFGDATLRASKLFKMRPEMRDGAPVESGTVRIPMTWTLPR